MPVHVFLNSHRSRVVVLYAIPRLRSLEETRWRRRRATRSDDVGVIRRPALSLSPPFCPFLAQANHLANSTSITAARNLSRIVTRIGLLPARKGDPSVSNLGFPERRIFTLESGRPAGRYHLIWLYFDNEVSFSSPLGLPRILTVREIRRLDDDGSIDIDLASIASIELPIIFFSPDITITSLRPCCSCSLAL